MLRKRLPTRLRQIGALATLLLVVGLDGCNLVAQTDESATMTPSSVPTINSTSPSTSSTSNPEGAIADRPVVVATNTVVCGLSRKIAVNTIDLRCLSTPDTQPQQEQPKPEDIQAIEQAKLILYTEDNLDPSLSRLIQTTVNSAPKVAVDNVAVSNRQQPDAEGQMVSDTNIPTAENAIKMAEVISNTLSQLKPDQASLYTANTQKIANELTQFNSWSQAEMDTLPADQRQLISNQQLLAYLNPSPWPEINERARLARVPVIMYHDIVPKKLVFFDVTQEEFEQHLQRLQSSGRHSN